METSNVPSSQSANLFHPGTIKSAINKATVTRCKRGQGSVAFSDCEELLYVQLSTVFCDKLELSKFPLLSGC